MRRPGFLADAGLGTKMTCIRCPAGQKAAPGHQLCQPTKCIPKSGCDSPDIAERTRSYREWITANPCRGVDQRVACKNGKWVCEPCKRPPDWSRSWCWDPRPGRNLVSECIDGKLVCKDLSPKPSDLISNIKGSPTGIPTEYLIGAAILAAILLLR